MKIAFVTTMNPNNKESRSGIPYSIFNQLARFYQVEWVNPNNIKLYKCGYWIFCAVYYAFRKFGYRITDHNPYIAKLTAIAIKKTIIQGKYDAIFMLAQIDAVYMNYGIPIYVRTDAIFNSAINYYWYGVPNWFVRQANKLEEKALDKLNGLFATSQWLSDEVVKYHPSKRYNNIKVVLSGANIEDSYIKWTPKEYGVDKPIRMLFVGYDLKRKGFDVAYKTMRIIKTKYKREVTLTVMGGKPSDEQINDTDLIYIGRMDKNKKDEYDKFYEEFSKANLFIFPTKAEFSAIVNCEAAAYALPIFTYNEGGTSSYVIDGYNGRVFETNADSHIFASSIIDAIDTGKMLEYSKNSRKHYEQELNWNHWGDVVHDYLEK